MSVNKYSGSKKKCNAKKRMLIGIAVIIGVIVFLLVCAFVIDFIQDKSNEVDDIDYNFYPADFEENIYEDEEYLELISEEFIKYCDSETNVTVGIDKETAQKQGKVVDFLVDMIYNIIEGDCESYNKKFSDEYYKENKPKERFTMQKLYDVTITYLSSENDGDYTKYYYCVEYKIYHNNGTFRRDIGAGSKKQYFTLTDASGELLIDNINTAKLTVK